MKANLQLFQFIDPRVGHNISPRGHELTKFDPQALLMSFDIFVMVRRMQRRTSTLFSEHIGPQAVISAHTCTAPSSYEPGTSGQGSGT